ncbi:unnamed protein product [Miscanthus lutarioriparius]|uniref:Uncharacterized protein n=1 Tax=Miscanthus lutarioriparius TaxID=422564 RepID=A0A811Q2B9_9POAL|nr:unnamed protein product [Miscanthus lutarioriparius]
MEAVEAYRALLALVQAQKNSSGSCKNAIEDADGSVTEFEIWQGLANLYSSLSYWRDAEICLKKAKALIKSYSAATLHAEGYMHQARDQTKHALAAYVNAFSTELEHVPSKVAIGAMLSKQGPRFLPAARCFLSDALRVEPTNRMAWLYLGKVHRSDGRISDAADCFQAALALTSHITQAIKKLKCKHMNALHSTWVLRLISERLLMTPQSSDVTNANIADKFPFSRKKASHIEAWTICISPNVLLEDQQTT